MFLYGMRNAPCPTLRRANPSGKGGSWQDEDYDVFDGECEVGRVHLVDGHGGSDAWFRGVSFRVIKRKSYGYAPSLEDAKAAFRAEYQAGKGTQK
jgi:hypothetical protein